jgi:RNA polymerase sigma factor (sigma-70 family)
MNKTPEQSIAEQTQTTFMIDFQTQASRLRQYIAAESAELVRTLRVYVLRAGFAESAQTIDSAAHELLNEVVVEALSHEDRFRSEAHPRAWLLGIAANLIKRRQSEIVRQQRREPLIRDLYPGLEESMSDDDLFDLMIEWADSTSHEAREQEEAISALLDTLPPNDSQILKLALLNGLNGDKIAQDLAISPGAARVRLHRALHRLRLAYQMQESL